MSQDSLELIELNLKLAGRTRGRNLLISAGRPEQKEMLLPAVRSLSELGLRPFATPGTSQFLSDNGVENTLVHKITDGAEPNIRSLLRQGSIDLIVNVLTGNEDYDEQSDSKVIRSSAIELGIPLFTEVDTASMQIDRLVRDAKAGRFDHRQAQTQAWNLRNEFLQMVRKKGGFASHHAHFDKAYLISMDNLRLGQVNMQKKWELYRHLKETYGFDDLVERISRGVDVMLSQGASYCRTMVDADAIVKTLPMKAALAVKEKYKGKIEFDIGVQSLEGVLDPDARRYYEEVCEMADFCGGLPSRDRPQPEKHLDVILSVAKRLGKRLDVHVDQENNPEEHETELLAMKTIEHGMEGRVFAVHSISLAAAPEREQSRVAKLLREAGVGVICCPSAALSMKQLDNVAPLHNSIAPVPLLVEHGVDVYLGVDNINDLFMPLTDGDMWFECRALMEACRFYDLDAVSTIAARRLPSD